MAKIWQAKKDMFTHVFYNVSLEVYNTQDHGRRVFTDHPLKAH